MRNHISRLTKTLALGTLVLAAGASLNPASATPATLGFYPATDIYGPGNFHLDVDSYGRGVRGDVGVSTGITYGIGDRDGAFGRSEVGFDYYLSAGGGQPINLSTGGRLSTSKRFLLNAKTQLFNNSENGTRVVAGVWGVGSKDFGAPNVAYVSGSKTFDFGRVHLGLANNFAGKIGGTRVTNLGGDDTKFSVSAGYDRYITPKLQFAVDYYSGKNSYAGIQPTLYYYINDKANFGLGLFRLNSKNANPRNQLYICFDYNFGGTAPAPVVDAAPIPETAPAAPASN
ncbi:MAG TPA: hypothetical protein VF681_10655 [Abditibacteriaceae bacterium]|jgi:hypothetical protein